MNKNILYITQTAKDGELLEDVFYRVLKTHINLDACFNANPHLLNKIYLNDGDLVKIPTVKNSEQRIKIKLW